MNVCFNFYSYFFLPFPLFFIMSSLFFCLSALALLNSTRIKFTVKTIRINCPRRGAYTEFIEQSKCIWHNSVFRPGEDAMITISTSSAFTDKLKHPVSSRLSASSGSFMLVLWKLSLSLLTSVSPVYQCLHQFVWRPVLERSPHLLTCWVTLQWSLYLWKNKPVASASENKAWFRLLWKNLCNWHCNRKLL